MAFSSILLWCVARAAVKNAVHLLTFGVDGQLLRDIWESNRPAKGGETGAMFEKIIARALEMKTGVKAEVSRL